MAEAKTPARRATKSTGKSAAAAKRDAKATAAAKAPAAVTTAVANPEAAPAKTARATRSKAAAKTRPVTRAARPAPAPAPSPEGKRPMSDSHKEALAAGREEGRAVRAYLDAVTRPKRPGRKRTSESVEAQLAKIDGRIAGASAANRLGLIQERFDLKRDLAALQAEAGVDIAALEASFVAVAPAYGKRKGISYAAWREAGVSAEVLRKAGISRRG
jgi:hypothetical protein